jgi:CheY-like chemotaxis protein
MQNLLVFLIDDDIDDQEVFEMALKEVQPLARCVFAGDGILALEKIKTDASFLPHIIFIDINMPRMNGVQCLRAIKRSSRFHHIPAFMYSTSAESIIVEECLKIGASGFIKKAIDVEDLQKQLIQVLRQVKTYSV